MNSNKIVFLLGLVVVVGLMGALYLFFGGDGDEAMTVDRTDRVTHEIKFPSGSRKETRDVITGADGRPLVHGLRTLYWEGGQKKMEMAYVQGKQTGHGVFWHQDGTRSIEGEFEGGQRHGKVTTWHTNGKKATEGDYRKGNEHGKVSKWSDAGALVEVGQYVNGVRHGDFIIYDLDGGSETVRYDSGRVIRDGE